MTTMLDAAPVSPVVTKRSPLAPLGKVVGSKYFKPALVGFILLFALFVIPTLGSYWVDNFRQMALFSTVAASAGMLYGRVGLVSLGQVAPYGIGIWTTIRLSFATTLPFPVLVLIGGLAAMVIGVLIGLPALRVSGLYLALVTLMLAAGIEIVISELKFANGGTGLRGVVKGLSGIKPTRRPSFALGDLAYYRFVVIGIFLLLMLATFVLARKPGRAWASIRQSEAAALSAGIDVTRYKILAFALASFMSGCAGGLFAGAIPKGMNSDSFTRQSAILLIAVAIMGGVYSLWGGLVAGFLSQIMVKFLTQNVAGHAKWQSFSLSLFGVGLIINLIQGTKKAEKKGIAP
jgi:branched-chain amino acid transport system permease protein